MSKPQILSDTKLPPSQMFDVRNADGQIVHVNIEDINQFLTYHEVFGKIGNAEHSFPPTSNTIPIPINNSSVPGSNAQSAAPIAPTTMPQSNPPTQAAPLIIPKIENIGNTPVSNPNSGAVSTASNVTNNNPSTATCAATSPNDDSSTMPSPGMHTCDICGKVFAFKYQFIGMEFGIVLSLCFLIGKLLMKTFFYHCFSVHRRYHNERKPFICQVCGQAFTTSQDLTSHGKIHEGVKMFICNVCFNVFANDASLERHMKRHSTDKPFGCTVCQKTFGRKEHLDNHFRSHSGETPFRLVLVLSVLYFANVTISIPMGNVNLNLVFRCQFCQKSFTRREHMQNHVRK